MKTEYLCGPAMLLTGSLANRSGVAAPSLPRAIFAGLKKSSAPEPFDQLKPTLRLRAQRLMLNHTPAELRGMMIGLPIDSVTRQTIEQRIAETPERKPGEGLNEPPYSLSADELIRRGQQTLDEKYALKNLIERLCRGKTVPQLKAMLMNFPSGGMSSQIIGQAIAALKESGGKTALGNRRQKR